MDPIAGLLSPQNRRNAKNQGLLAAGLNLLSNSGWKPIREDRGTLANFADAATAGLGAYQTANERALEVQDYEQQIAEQRAQKEAAAQQKARLEMIVQNIGRDGQFGTREQRQAWVAKAMSGGVETMQEAVNSYEESLNQDPMVVGKDSRLVQGDGTVLLGSEDDSKPWFEQFDPNARLAIAKLAGKPDLNSFTPEDILNLDMNEVWRLNNEAKTSGASRVTVNPTLGQREGSAVDEALTDRTASTVEGVFTNIDNVRSAMDYANLSTGMSGDVIAGFAAEPRLALAKALQLTGMSSEEIDASIAKTETAVSFLGTKIFDVLASGALGSGSGISDKDMETAAKVVLADMNNTESGRIQAMYYSSLVQVGRVFDDIARMEEQGAITAAQAQRMRLEAKSKIGDANDVRRRFAGIRINGELVLPHILEDLNNEGPLQAPAPWER